MKKRIFAALLTVLMLVAMSVVALADDTNGEVPGAATTKGGTVTVNIKLTNNPGIAGATFKVVYDSNVLKPLDENYVKAGDISDLAIIQSYKTDGEVTFIVLGYNVEEDIPDGHTSTSTGVIASVVFTVDSEAPIGNTTVSVVCTEAAEGDENGDGIMEDQTVIISQGTIEIKDYTPGDVNNDGNVNSFDRSILARHIANWPGYTANDISMAAADVNGDGNVNSFDRSILARHIANWPGYETLPVIQ